MNRLELRMRYKAETAQKSEPLTAYAKRGRYGAVILDEYCLDERFLAMTEDKGTTEIELPDPSYTEWLEEKVIELLTK